MPRLRIQWSVLAAFAAGALVVVWFGQRKPGPVPAEDWDIPRLAAFLNERGLDLRVVSTLHFGPPHPTAFLTTTDKQWEDLNRLFKGSVQPELWRGTLYCEHGIESYNWSELARQWGDRCLVAGPFLFYGDPELLARVRAALSAARS